MVRPSDSNVAQDIVAALTIATLQISMAISFAALLFTGPLSAGTPRAAAGFIVGTAVVVGAVGARTRMAIALGGSQDMAIVVAIAVVSSIASSTADDERLASVYVAIALVTLATGVVFLVVGRRHLGAMARSIPFTVVSGFLAGTGWLLARGGFEVMVGRSLSWDGLVDVFDWSDAQRWLPGVGLALGLTVLLRAGVKPVVIGVALAGTAIVVHGLARIVASGTWLEENDWLIGPFPAAEGWTPIRPSDLQTADWSAIGAESVGLSAMVAVSVIGLLLNLTGLESMTDADIDLDHELEIAGWSNAVAAFGGGVVGYHLIGDTTIARQMGARGRRVPVLVGLLCLIAVMVGTDSVGQVPRAIAGGVLAMSGINLLVDWLRQARSDLNRLDAGLSAGVLAVIVAFGVLPGIAAGVLASAIVFVVSYSRVSPVVAVRNLGDVESNVDRSESARRHLADRRAEAAVIELDGYLFFGSLSTVSAAAAPLLDDDRLKVLIVDLARVQGLDSSVIEGFASLERRARGVGVRVVWSGLTQQLARRFGSTDERLRAPDLDHALEAAENMLLEDQAGDQFDRDDEAFASWSEAIEAYGDVRRLEAGETLIEAGSETSTVFVVVLGELTAWRPNGSRRRRLRRVGRGSVLGELAHYTGAPRTATVVADTEAVVIALDGEALDELAERDVELALQTERIFAARLARRVAVTSANLRDDHAN